MTNRAPINLFKFCKFDKRIISCLINHELWFSNPSDFNDPYDCKLELDTENTIDEIRSHLNKSNNRHTEYCKKIQDPTRQIAFINELYNFRLDKDQVFQIIDGIYSKNKLVFNNDLIEHRLKEIEQNKHNLSKVINETAQRDVKKYRILCLSKNVKNSVMWAHYSDNHNGICIGLDHNQDINFFKTLLRVKYVSEYPIYNYIREYDTHMTVQHVFGTKSMDWKYEREYRIIKDINSNGFRNNGLLKFNKKILTRIYFGLKTKQEDIDIIKEINKNYYDAKIKLFIAHENPKSFELNFEQIK